MALFNHATKELTAKIVFYGPESVEKRRISRSCTSAWSAARETLSLSTAQDRTIYFDLLPSTRNIKGYTVRFQVCTVPGQVFYNETRRIVLRGVDGLVFVVDSQWSMLSHNLESFQNLRENLADEKIPLESLPVVIQYNKRDLPSALSVEALQESLGFHSYPYVEAVASEGMGVLETFKLASKLTFVDHLRRLQRGWQPPTESDLPSGESSLGSASGPGGSTQPFAGPGPAVTISAPAPEPEEEPSGAPVLALVGRGSAAAEEEPSEWVPPSAEGTFADLSDDSLKAAPARADAGPSAAAPQPSTLRPEPVLGAAASSVAPAANPSVSGERPRSRSETTAPVTPLDDKLNAVLAEARKAAAVRVSAPSSDEHAAPDVPKADLKRVEALESARGRREVPPPRGARGREAALEAENPRAKAPWCGREVDGLRAPRAPSRARTAHTKRSGPEGGARGRPRRTRSAEPRASAETAARRPPAAAAQLAALRAESRKIARPRGRPRRKRAARRRGASRRRPRRRSRRASRRSPSSWRPRRPPGTRREAASPPASVRAGWRRRCAARLRPSRG